MISFSVEILLSVGWGVENSWRDTYKIKSKTFKFLLSLNKLLYLINQYEKESYLGGSTEFEREFCFLDSYVLAEICKLRVMITL